MSEDRQLFIQYLNKQVIRYLGVLEEMFGPRDQRFVFGSVRQSHYEYPCTFFPYNYYESGGCVVDIHVGKIAWENLRYYQSTWQVAHECVHLLDPCELGGANVLEEGLAAWFQDEPEFHNYMVKSYIFRGCNTHSENYNEAKRLVVECQSEKIVPAVKEIRSSDTAIRHITPDILADHLPHVDKDIIEKLCNRFE